MRSWPAAFYESLNERSSTSMSALNSAGSRKPSILKAAKKAGVKWYFIEDESPWSEKQIPQSLRYLEQVKF